MQPDRWYGRVRQESHRCGSFTRAGDHKINVNTWPCMGMSDRRG